MKTKRTAPAANDRILAHVTWLEWPYTGRSFYLVARGECLGYAPSTLHTDPYQRRCEIFVDGESDRALEIALGVDGVRPTVRTRRTK